MSMNFLISIYGKVALSLKEMIYRRFAHCFKEIEAITNLFEKNYFCALAPCILKKLENIMLMKFSITSKERMHLTITRHFALPEEGVNVNTLIQHILVTELDKLLDSQLHSPSSTEQPIVRSDCD